MTNEYVEYDKIIDEKKINKNGLCKACFMNIEDKPYERKKQQRNITKT
jgi:hypothetical protein